MSKTKFLEDKNGKQSSTRIAFVILVIHAILISSFMIYKDKDIMDTILIFSNIMGYALALKLGHTAQENKYNNIDNPK